MKKLICLILAITMIFSMLLIGCAKDEEKKTAGGAGEVVTQETKDTSRIYDAEIKKLNRTFTFIVREASATHLNTNEFYAESLNGDKINDAVFTRNSKMNEVYGTELVEIRDTALQTNYKDSLISGEYVADFLFTGVSAMKNLGNANLLVNFYDLTQLNLNKAWWNKTMTDSLAINNKAFYVTGDCATLDDRATWIMIFNKDIITNAGLESPYKLVNEGKWTIDAMYKYMQDTSVPGDDGIFQYNKEGDIIGYCGETFNNYVHVAAANLYIGAKSADGLITIPDQPKQEIVDAWSALRTLLTSNMRYMSGGSTAFLKGWATFSGLNTAVITKWAAQEVNFGILPFPKVYESQTGYYTAPSYAQLGVISIPQTVEADASKDWLKNGFASAAEQCAYYLEGFSYWSMNILTPAFYDQVLSKQSVSDADSAANLALTLDTKQIVYDPVAIFNFGKIGYAVFSACGADASTMAGDTTKHDELVSTYTSRVDAARTAIEDFMNITTA